MNDKQLSSRILAVLTATFIIVACSPHIPKEEMPAVNDENCKPESIAKIKDQETREKFGSTCFTRGQFKPSPKKEW